MAHPKLQALFETENLNLRSQGILKIVLGLGITAFSVLLVYILSWFIGWAILGAERATATAVVLTSVYLVAAFIVAWRRIQPLVPLYAIADLQTHAFGAKRSNLSGTSSATLRAQRRQAIAGFAWMPFAGAASILDGVARLHSRFPTDAHFLEACAETLSAASRTQGLERLIPEVYAILEELHLVRQAVGMDGKPAAVLTNRGRELVG